MWSPISTPSHCSTSTAAATATFTDYDMPPKNMEPGARPKLTSAEGHLDLRYASSAGATTWTTCRDSAGELIPFTYDYAAFGATPDTTKPEPQWNCGCT